MRNLKYVFLLCCFLCYHGYAQQNINLSALDLSHAWQEFGTVQKGKSVDGKPAVVAGKQYNDVVGVHAKSTIKVNLDKQAIRFTVRIAIAECTTFISHDGSISPADYSGDGIHLSGGYAKWAKALSGAVEEALNR